MSNTEQVYKAVGKLIDEWLGMPNDWNKWPDWCKSVGFLYDERLGFVICIELTNKSEINKAPVQYDNIPIIAKVNGKVIRRGQ